MLSAVTTFSACLRRQVVYSVCGCMLSAILQYCRQPLEDGQTIVTETCRVSIMCFTNIFNNLEM